jgi:hypothetical protein
VKLQAASSETSGSTKRFRKLFKQLSDGTGKSIPLDCQDWANTKAAYRFLSNHRVTEGDILASLV